MRLYLVQHAKAASEQADPQRPLTEEGLRDIHKVAAFIKPLSLSIDYLWHSGKKRALQTAEILAEVVLINKTASARSGLAPNDDVTILNDQLQSLQHDVMIVGHQPFLGKLVSLLLAGCLSANAIAFKQGGIVCLSCPEGNQWQIEWMIIPDLL